jgi:4-hydroxy-tetrahydrodipicolinate synthase
MASTATAIATRPNPDRRAHTVVMTPPIRWAQVRPAGRVVLLGRGEANKWSDGRHEPHYRHAMAPHLLAGLHVPLITPFDDDDQVDLGALEKLALRFVEAGAAGLVALATTGEATALTADERRSVVATVAGVTAATGARLIVGAGPNDTRTTIAWHQALAEVPGVDASLAVVPYYVRPSEAAIVAHFQAVAAASPVPLVLYNIPYRTGRGLGAAALLELAATDNVIGLKQAVGGVDADTLTVLADAPARFAVLGGDDPYLLPVVLMGGTGAIAASAHLHTAAFAAMLARGGAGDVAGSRPIAEALLSLVLSLVAEPSPAIIKAVLHHDGLIRSPAVRMPLAAASAAGLQDALRASALAAERLAGLLA